MGYEQYDCSFKLHLRAARAFLGLPKTVTSFGLVSEMNWLLPESQTELKMIRYFGRLLKHLLKKVYIWDNRLNKSEQLFSWSSEIKSIFYNNNLNHVYDAHLMFPVKDIVKQLE